MSPKHTALSRRAFLERTTFAAAATWFGAGHASSLFAQMPSDPLAAMRAQGLNAKITVQTARRNVSVLLGSGGNIAVLTGKDGKLLVDSGYASSQPQITEALGGLSSDPIKRLIDTHWHFDHTDGNEWLHGAGATIIAHENTKKRLSTPQVIADFNMHFPASPAGAIPTMVFAGDHTVHTNGETLKLAHYAPAHTDSDISVHFVNANVLHTGDTWFNGYYPFIDYSSGGSIDGMIAAAEVNLAIATPSTIIIPGHGPVGDRTQLADSHQMLMAVREKVAGMKKQGKTLDETVAGKPTAEFDAKWGAGLVVGDFFTKLVYEGV